MARAINTDKTACISYWVCILRGNTQQTPVQMFTSSIMVSITVLYTVSIPPCTYTHTCSVMPFCQCSDTVLASQQLVNRQKLESSNFAFVESCTPDIGQLADRNSTRQ